MTTLFRLVNLIRLGASGQLKAFDPAYAAGWEIIVTSSVNN